MSSLRFEFQVLTSDCDFGHHVTAAHVVAGDALVTPSILSGGQVDLEIASVNHGPRWQASIQLDPRVGQRRGPVSQTLQPDHLPDPHGHVVRHRRGVGERWGEEEPLLTSTPGKIFYFDSTAFSQQQQQIQQHGSRTRNVERDGDFSCAHVVGHTADVFSRVLAAHVGQHQSVVHHLVSPWQRRAQLGPGDLRGWETWKQVEQLKNQQYIINVNKKYLQPLVTCFLTHFKVKYDLHFEGDMQQNIHVQTMW